MTMQRLASIISEQTRKVIPIRDCRWEPTARRSAGSSCSFGVNAGAGSGDGAARGGSLSGSLFTLVAGG
jgi:hypothetical protein